MLDLIEIADVILPGSPGPEIRIEDVHIDIEQSGGILPNVHIDGRIDIRIPW